jgi:hypothetical protein
MVDLVAGFGGNVVDDAQSKNKSDFWRVEKNTPDITNNKNCPSNYQL